MSDTRAHEGGTEWELAQAEHAIAAAGIDMDALARAQRRHADAIRNMMQGVLVPMFVELVERALGPKIEAVGIGVEGLRTEVATRLGKTEQTIEDLVIRVTALEANNARLEALEDAIAALRAASARERTNV